MSRIATLEAFADREPTNADLLCDLLDSLLSEGQTERASARLQQVSPSLRELPGVIFREARIALIAGDFPKVVLLLQPLAASLQPAPSGLCHDLALGQFLLGDLDGALHTLSLAAADDGDDVAGFTLLKARIWHHQHRISDALALLDGSDAENRTAEWDGVRSLLLLDNGQTSEAAALAARALGRDPGQFEAGLVVGTLALWERRADVAVPLFQQLVATRPNAGRAYLGLGEGLMMRGDTSGAMPALERATATMANHMGTWHALAWCQLLQGNLEGAQQSFDRAFALDRTFGETHGGRALIHALRGERDAANEAIKRALRLDPEGRSARYAQSVLLLDEGKETEAQAIIQELMGSSQGWRTPVTPEFVYTLRALLRSKRGGHGGH